MNTAIISPIGQISLLRVEDEAVLDYVISRLDDKDPYEMTSQDEPAFSSSLFFSDKQEETNAFVSQFDTNDVRVAGTAILYKKSGFAVTEAVVAMLKIGFFG
jgi:hypothetical protein